MSICRVTCSSTRPATMATNAKTMSPRRLQRAFTLIELLIVVMIIGLLAGITIISVSSTGRDREIEREIFRLEQVIAYLHDEALLQNLDFGIMFSETGYRFYVFDHGVFTWSDSADELLTPYDFEGEIQVELQVEGQTVDLEREYSDEMLDTPEPQLLLYSTGEMSPFELYMFRDLGAGRFGLTGELDGKLETLVEGYDD